MENCINCNKEYKIRGMKLHRRKCDIVYLENKKKEQEAIEKKINIVYSHEKKYNIGNYLPDDCVKIIYEFLTLRDKNTSYRKLYTDIMNVAIVCKNFYINKPNMKNIKNNMLIELDETICKSWSMDMYDLTSDEMESLNYDIVRKGWNRTMHLFNIADVKDLAYKKYGTEFDYNNYLRCISRMKLLSKKNKDIIYEKRKDEYNKMFEKYNYNKITDLVLLHQNYIDIFVKKKIPTIHSIEDEIKDILYKIDLKKKLIIELDKENIDYYETKEVLNYNKNKRNSIILNKYNIELAVKSIKDRMVKEEFYKTLNMNEFKELAYSFINNSQENMDQFLKLIEKINFIRKHMDNNKKTFIKTIFTKSDVEYYIDDVINNWCNKNKENDLTSFDFINDLDNKYKKKIIDKFSDFNKIKKIKMNRFDISLCICNNIASMRCIDYLCKKCCKNTLCIRHN